MLEHVGRLAAAGRPEVILIHVAESAASRYLGEESSDQEQRSDQAALDALVTQFRDRGVTARALLGFGAVKSELARLVGECQPDVLVTGSHGHRLIGDLLYGATASGVRHMVRVPVLSVPQKPTAE